MRIFFFFFTCYCFSWINTFTLCIVQESIGDEVIADAKLSSDMGRRGHFSDGISLENGDDFEGNDIFNYWVETFCEYNIDDQLDGFVRHLSRIDEECLGIFSVSIFDCQDDDIQTCVPHDFH